MAIQVKFRRGSSAQHTSFTGANGEITVDTTNKTIRVHDGVTVGGVRIAKYSEIGEATLANTNASIATQAARITLVNTNLTGTNTAIRALDAQKLSVANATTLFATKASWAALTSTNTALRVLISDRLQVANATTLLAAKATWTALTGTNTALRTLISARLQVANATTLFNMKATWTALTGTNTALRTLISDRYQVANVNTLLATKATWSGLTGTNTALRTLISDRLQVANATATYQTKTIERAALANTNAYIAAQASRITLVNTNLTGTNTALRTLIADRLQVANAAVIYQTKTIERAALANTNASIATQTSRITLVNTNLTGTNTALRTLISDRLQVANAATIYTTKVNPTTSGVFAHTGRATISTNLGVTGNTSVGGNLTVTGDFTVNGTTTAINSTTISVDDINITLGDTAVPTNVTADGGGITLKGTTDKTFNWVSATASWTSSENINLASTKTLFLNGVDFRATFAANSYVKSVLANTNSFIKSQLANTNASIATQSFRITLVNTNLTGTNTALRTLISDRLQVANAATIYQTKTIERAALANTNASIATQTSRITLVNTNLLATNTAIRALDAAKLSVANAATIYTTKVNPTTSGIFAHTGRATISTNLGVTGNTSVNGRLQVINGGYNNPAIRFGTDGDLYFNSSGVFSVTFGGGTLFTFSPSYFNIGSADDIRLYRDAANILAQRNGVNAQTNRIYGTYTDGSNYERLSLSSNSTASYIQTEAAGTGTLRNIALLGGKVGIGTSSPIQALTVNGNIAFPDSGGSGTYNIKCWGYNDVINLNLSRNNSLTSTANELTIQTYSQTIIGTTTVANILSVQHHGAGAGQVLISGSLGGAAGGLTNALGVAGGVAVGAYAVYPTGANAPSGGLIVSGNIGIGITAPTAKLTVASGTSATTQHIYGTYTDGSNYERIAITANSSGNYIAGEKAGTGSARSLNLISQSGQIFFNDGNSQARMTSGTWEFGNRSLTQVTDVSVGNSTVKTVITPTTISLINIALVGF